jgi:hypothetical protein
MWVYILTKGVINKESLGGAIKYYKSIKFPEIWCPLIKLITRIKIKQGQKVVHNKVSYD